MPRKGYAVWNLRVVGKPFDCFKAWRISKLKSIIPFYLFSRCTGCTRTASHCQIYFSKSQSFMGPITRHSSLSGYALHHPYSVSTFKFIPPGPLRIYKKFWILSLMASADELQWERNSRTQTQRLYTYLFIIVTTLLNVKRACKSNLY